MFKVNRVFLLIAFCILLSACNDKIIQTAKETEERNVQAETKKEAHFQELETEQKNIYKEHERPVEEVVQDNELDELSILEGKNPLTVKSAYEDESEFAIYLSEVLFNFQNGSLNAEDYYDFLLKHGTEKALSDLPPERADAIVVFNSIQKLFLDNAPKRESYRLSEVTLNRTQREGHFYRKIKNKESYEFYITTIIKEGDAWKYEDDSPSPPFEITEDQEL